MVAKSIYREAFLYKVATNNPTIGLRTPAIQMQPPCYLEGVNDSESSEAGPVPAALVAVTVNV